jgi:hypothetical protein
MFTTVAVAVGVLCWFLPSFLVSWAASKQGRSGGGWFFVSLFCSPGAALLALIATPWDREKVAALRRADERWNGNAWVSLKDGVYAVGVYGESVSRGSGRSWEEAFANADKRGTQERGKE